MVFFLLTGTTKHAGERRESGGRWFCTWSGNCWSVRSLAAWQNRTIEQLACFHGCAKADLPPIKLISTARCALRPRLPWRRVGDSGLLEALQASTPPSIGFYEIPLGALFTSERHRSISTGPIPALEHPPSSVPAHVSRKTMMMLYRPGRCHCIPRSMMARCLTRN